MSSEIIEFMRAMAFKTVSISSSIARLSAVVALLLTVGVSAPAQVKNADINPSTGNLPIQKVGLNDLVSIQVYDSPELTRTVRISEDGTLRLPLLNEPIHAAGLYPPELEQEITTALKDQGILVRPIVSVTISEYRSRPIRVVGAVKKPVTFQDTGNIHLLDAITAAEGVTDAAGPDILVSTPNPAGGPELVQRFSRRQLVDQADENLNIRLSGGEEVRVPEAGKVWVIGNVKRPGPFPVRDPGDMTVLKVVAQAELMPFSSTNAYISRTSDNPKGGQVEVPLTKILERKSPDIPLQPNDILYVPDSKSKRNVSNIIQIATGFGIGTMSGLLIFRH
jgi:polysaccharide export outer membrane protein